MPGKHYILFALYLFGKSVIAQPPASLVVVKDALEENRTRLYRNLVNNTISKNLSLTLTDSTQENWIDAFYALGLIRYQTLWVNGKIAEAFKKSTSCSEGFQTSLVELVKANYPSQYVAEVQLLKSETSSDKIFALCAEYLLSARPLLRNDLIADVRNRMDKSYDTLVLLQLKKRLINNNSPVADVNSLKKLFQHDFFSGAKIVFSIQRKNRDFPGIAIVRDSVGDFIKDENGFIFTVPQLARSITNMPFYFRNGNTPQGIFRMHGIAVSKGNFIGPTPNIQLTMPFETSIKHFMNDSTINDSIWTERWYKKLLPDSWKDNPEILGTYYAGEIGRNEIIAHGTTINPAYYKTQSFFPLTPTLGCLCTKEIWNEEDGTLLKSDQKKLIDALQKAGGANGYLVVIELDDEQRPVILADIEKYLL